jgi:sporulation protein YlmC with PRC-barrel domain
MKRLAAIVVAASVMGLGAADALAQAQRPGDAPARDTQRDKGPAWKAPAGAVESKHIIGTRVKDREGKDVGEIDQLIVNREDGKITHAVIGYGGMLGIGERKVVVPWSDVTMAPDKDNRDRMVVTMERSTLESAPRYEAAAARDRTPAASPATDRPARPATDGDKKSNDKK